MSFLERFLGGGRSKAYSEGMTLLEDGNFAEAVDRLRVAALDKADSPSGTLASFYFRQALVGEGRRLMRIQRFSEALDPLSEAVRLWDLYPDLHCLYGTACGFDGDWDEALSQARAALRINPDYVEARLLESVSLQHLERILDSANSLNALVESGRRVGHWVISSLESEEIYSETNLPDNLDKLLLQCISGRSEKEEVAEAVALCRSGQWDEGLDKFTVLVAKRPRYPDYRTRLAAALFQVGRLDDALTEVDAALALNESYSTAIDLKGLILADQGCVMEAREFLDGFDSELASQKKGGAHEELFGAYLRGALALLTGDPEKVAGIFEGWPNLARTFARAELLLAAADDLQERSSICGRRLADLADEWAAESLYFHLLACHHLEDRKYKEVSEVLSRWPASGTPDARPLFLESCLAVCQGRVPSLPQERLQEGPQGISDAAWDFLEARTAYLEGNDDQCRQICGALINRGFVSERILRLQLAAALKLGGTDELPSCVMPDSCLPGAIYLALQKGDSQAVAALLEASTGAHPDGLSGFWLSPGFWLDPIRNWIA